MKTFCLPLLVWVGASVFSNPERLAPNDVVTLDTWQNTAASPALGWLSCLSFFWFFVALASALLASPFASKFWATTNFRSNTDL